VLVVDDSRDGADSLAVLLRHLGAEVRVANDGPAALEVLREFGPEAAIVDIGMPGITGFEVARRIRMRPEHAGITLIALTGWGQEADRSRTRSAGFDHHLIKPADLESLRHLLTSLVPAQR
jgi:CheY-like chemotaxis protein